MIKKTIIIMVLLFLMLFCFGCKKKTIEKESILETMPIDPNCAADESQNNNCCLNQCTTYCLDHNQAYFKHDINGPTCMCWCD